jgi:hypothetical protein
MNTRPVLDALGQIPPARWVEWFVVANIAFLGVDIAVAHTENGFARPAEWAPIAFSAVATLLLLPMAFGLRGSIQHGVDLAVGVGAVLVGVAGMGFHLQSGFFLRTTLHELVYSAPFVAPLAYVGVGLLLLLVRSPETSAPEFAWWVMLLALGGFVGNLTLSLLDHAQNAFFRPVEWLSVVAAAFGVAFLFVAWIKPEGPVLYAALVVMGVEAAIGAVGFVLHVAADLHRAAARITDRFVFGAPAFAPLLFTDIAVLGVIAIAATKAARAQPA